MKLFLLAILGICIYFGYMSFVQKSEERVLLAQLEESRNARSEKYLKLREDADRALSEKEEERYEAERKALRDEKLNQDEKFLASEYDKIVAELKRIELPLPQEVSYDKEYGKLLHRFLEDEYSKLSQPKIGTYIKPDTSFKKFSAHVYKSNDSRYYTIETPSYGTNFELHGYYVGQFKGGYKFATVDKQRQSFAMEGNATSRISAYEVHYKKFETISEGMLSIVSQKYRREYNREIDRVFKEQTDEYEKSKESLEECLRVIEVIKAYKRQA